MKKILFVCTGNTCRSSMAEAFFKAAIENNSSLAGKFSASSAGMAALNGLPASENSIHVLKTEWGLDLSIHRSRSITKDEINDAFLILTMTQSHKEALAAAFPHLQSRIYTIKEYVMDKNDINITDPYGMPANVYSKCASEIKDAVDLLIEKLSNDEVITPDF